ncbi:hypothetical protein AKA01nite_16330 [Alkalibacterium kapii]|uniref:Uncharacterized protein n=1 Tax=Alkalibacterium kapii TaxID=426704 RepID=A0A511AXZ8_9LACT|nr:hypothetical protein AKA01nite_16330 [Alkalibacterium kapii]
MKILVNLNYAAEKYSVSQTKNDFFTKKQAEGHDPQPVIYYLIISLKISF